MGKDIKLRRALLSVSNKNGIVELATALVDQEIEIISTGGTGRKLTEAGITYTEISKVTGNPEAFGGRMKTISFQIGSALLYDRERDVDEARALDIEPIDLVVCNLYPFKEAAAANAEMDELVENIDIGGPTMVRAAAKNFKYVTVLTNPEDYASVIQELHDRSGQVSYSTRRRLMRKAFNHTADYDSMIAEVMDAQDEQYSKRLHFSGGIPLRYGENSHQSARYYRETSAQHSLYDMNVLHGKALSFNNILDINGAIESLRGFAEPACSVIKHSNPCGLAVGIQQARALALAWQGDPISAFGSIIAFNRPLELETVKFLQLDAEDRSQRKFVEVVIAPEIPEQTLAYLQNHKNLRVIQHAVNEPLDCQDLRYFNGSLLVQDQDSKLLDETRLAGSTEYDIQSNLGLIEFGLKAISTIKSNSIAIVRKKDGFYQLLGMGAGQPNRLVATKLALDKSLENLRLGFAGSENVEASIQAEIGRCLMISDAFFPFGDNVELAASRGIRAIVQPGGSIRDKEVVTTADRFGVAMIMTGLRHFKH